MSSERKTAIVVGVLFIVATASAVLSGLLLGFTGVPDYLGDISANEARLIGGALLELVMVAAVLGIPVLLFPILKRDSENVARGYLIIRAFEAVVLVGCVFSAVLLLTLGREFAVAGAAAGGHFETLGALLVKTSDWASLIGGQIVFAFTALILNYSLFRSRLIPRLLSGWGLVGVPFMLVGGGLVLFGVVSDSSTIQTALMLPLAVQEMVFALWLIVKGFTPAATASR